MPESTDLYRLSWKLERGYYDAKPFRWWTDAECDWWEDARYAWEDSIPYHTVYEWRKACGWGFQFNEQRGRIDKTEIKERVDIVGVYRALHPTLKVVKRCGKISAQCFMHDDLRPSMSIAEDTKLYYCHAGCGGGDVIKLVQDSLSCSFIDALKWLSTY